MKTSWKKKMKNKGGFTLIELLIVIGLLGALTALILPRLAADRRTAIEDVMHYNVAGTMRTLKQHKTMAGTYPDYLHTGFVQAEASGILPMPGLPRGAGQNLMRGGLGTGRRQLTATEAASLTNAGIANLSVGATGSVAVAALPVVAVNVTAWRSDGEARTTHIDGRSIADWQDSGNYTVIPFYVTPKAVWGKGTGGNQDWTKGNFEVSLDLVGKVTMSTSPYGTDGNGAGQDSVDFPYVTAFFLVDSNDADGVEAARLIGIGGPSGSILNK